MVWVKILTLLLCLFFTNSSFADVRVILQPFAPFSIHKAQNGSNGFSVELLKLVMAKDPKLFKGDNVQYVPSSFNRMFMELKHGERRISVALGKNPERIKKFKWAGPYFTIDMGVIALKKNKINIEEISDFDKYTIASIKNAAAEQALIRQGVDVGKFERTPKPKQALLKLISERVDLMTHAIQSTSYMISQLGYNHRNFEKVYKIKSLDLYFAFSQDFEDKEIEDFNLALNNVIKSPDYRTLINKYYLDKLNRNLDLGFDANETPLSPPKIESISLNSQFGGR